MNEKDDGKIGDHVDNRDSSVTTANPTLNGKFTDDSTQTNHSPCPSDKIDIAGKQSIRVTRSDPLSSTSNKSHLIRNKHQHHHPHHSSSSNGHPTSHYHSRERRARWIRDRMSAGANYYNNQYSNLDNNHCCNGYHCSCCSGEYLDRHENSREQPTDIDNFSAEDVDKIGFNISSSSTGQGSGTNNTSTWISENDSKANRFHRPYSLREQRSWNAAAANHHYHNREAEVSGDHSQYQNRQRLRAGLSLPSQNSTFQFPSFPLVEETRLPITQTATVSFLEDRNIDKEEEEEENDEEDGEEDQDEGLERSYLRRQRKLPYPYRLKNHHSSEHNGTITATVTTNLGAGVPPLEIVRRSRSGSPCSITSESTESLGDCENALDPPRIGLPNGDVGGVTSTGGAVPVTYGMTGQYGNNNGRKFSILFASHDTWSEENIVSSFKELTPAAATLFEAAWTGNVDQIEEILKVEENQEKLKDPGPNGFRDGDGRTPLHLASACGHVACVEKLLEQGAPVNATEGNENRATPLACAASCGSVPVVRTLLEGGADVNAGYEQGKTALHWAIQASSVECAKILLEAGAKQNPPQVYSETPLHVSASQGDPESLQLLLDHGADVNLCKGSNRSTALHLSSEEGSAACVRLLLKAGASHAAKDIRGHSALHVAATCDADCVIALLKAGADPNAVDANGRTPLHCAVARGSRAAECVRLLVESGADIDAQDNYGYTPTHLSAVNESSQCASILLHHGSDVTLKTNAGTTALSLLVRRIPDVMRYLVDRLDSAVTIHDHDPGDPDCEVRLDFRAIVPNCEKKHLNGNGKNNGNGHVVGAPGGGSDGGSDRRKKDYFSKPHKETEFLTCLVGAGNKKILAHPLSEAFLTLKWRRVRKFFWASLLFQIALVALFTIYVVEVYLIRCPYERGHPEGYNESDGDELDHPGQNAIVTVIPPQPPLPIPPDPYKLLNNGTGGDSPHNVTRRSANPEPSFTWFSVRPPKKKNRTRSTKKPKQPVLAPHLPLSSPVPPTQRTRSRGNPIFIIPPPAAAPATSRPPEESGEEYSDRAPRMDPIKCRLDNYLPIIWILLVAFTSLMAIKEIFQLIQSPLSYVVSSENWGQWLLISSVTLTAWSTPEFQLEYWQYPAAACGIFLAWGLMLLQVGRFPALGLYVQMLGKVAANFGLFILAYACLLLAFALAFCVLFHESPPYSSVPLSVLKVFTMMVGEVDYEDLFYGKDRNDPTLFYATAHLLYGAFVVIVTIVLMNLLVGLAVHDIQGLQKGAKLNRLSRQTALISRLESFIFSKKLQTVLPRSLGSLLQKSALLVPSSYNWSYYFRPNDPRDKRLPKDIKLAALRLAASRHSSTKSKSNNHRSHHYLSSTNVNHHRNTPNTTTAPTPLPPIIRPVSNASHHPHHTASSSSALFSHHPEIAMRRLEQRLDHLQGQLEKAVHGLNGRLDVVLGVLKSDISRGRASILSAASSHLQKGHQSDIENDAVFVEEEVLNKNLSSSLSPSSSIATRRESNRPPISASSSFFERCQL